MDKRRAELSQQPCNKKHWCHHYLYILSLEITRILKISKLAKMAGDFQIDHHIGLHHQNHLDPIFLISLTYLLTSETLNYVTHIGLLNGLNHVVPKTILLLKVTRNLRRLQGRTFLVQ